MKVKGILAAIAGVTQSIIGLSIITFAYALIYNSDVQSFVQTMLDIERPIGEVLPLFLLLILTFGFFSIISGLLLIQEWRKLR
jgi:cell division protein FtsX